MTFCQKKLQIACWKHWPGAICCLTVCDSCDCMERRWWLSKCEQSHLTKDGPMNAKRGHILSGATSHMASAMSCDVNLPGKRQWPDLWLHTWCPVMAIAMMQGIPENDCYMGYQWTFGRFIDPLIFILFFWIWYRVSQHSTSSFWFLTLHLFNSK